MSLRDSSRRLGATQVWKQERDIIKSVFIKIPRTKAASMPLHGL